MVTIKELKSVDDFHEFKNESDGKLRCAKLMAPWCGPCKVLTEVIKNLDKEKIGDTLFAEIDIDTDETEAVGEEYKVRGVPVLIFFKNGEEVGRIVGLVTANVIYDKINELM